MKDSYESRLRLELQKLAEAVPAAPAPAAAGDEESLRRGAEIRPALPLRSLLAAVLLVLAVVLEAPRLTTAPAGGPVTGLFVETGSMTVGRATPVATLLRDGRVLVAGGSFANPRAADIYDPATGKFTATGSLAAGRMLSTATLLPDGRVLVAGGTGGLLPTDAALASAELYDPSTGRFSPAGSMITPRCGHTATLLGNGKVLIAGGFIANGGPMDELGAATAELYDPATGTFTPTGRMITPRDKATATLLKDGRVLIAGGESPYGPQLSAAELYDPATGTFSATGSMNIPRENHTATLLLDGRVLMAGLANQDSPRRDSAELYDPATGEFSFTGSMSADRASAIAVRLRDGRVLVAGGGGMTFDSERTAELYDPETGQFSTAAPTKTARIGAAAVLLADGKVLVLGGEFNHPGTVGEIDSAELFDPSGGG